MATSSRTLVDALLTLGVAGSLATAFSEAAVLSRAQSDRQTCLTNMRRLAQGLLLYAADHQERFAPTVRDDRGLTGCLERNPKFVPILNSPGNPGWVTHFVPGSQWNKLVLRYAPKSALTCPADPTTPYKAAPSLSYTAASGPESLWVKGGCEVLNGVMGTNWGAALSQVERPSGTALLYEHIINPAMDPWQHNVGTVDDEDWTGRKDQAWCFGKGN